jgi:hypothetical protein
VLLALLAALAVASPANAALPAGNVVQNGDAEAGPGATSDTQTQAPPGWDTIPNFTAVVYGTGAFPSAAISTSIRGGANFFAGGPSSGFGDTSYAQQALDLVAYGPDLDAGNVQMTLAADQGGTGVEGDSTAISAVTTNAAGDTGTGFVTLPRVTPEERGNATGFVHRTDCTTLQPGTRRGFVTVTAQRLEGSSYNDGYADNISLTFSTAPCPPKADAPLPPPTPEPVPGVSANADVSKGRVFVKRPGGTTFLELRDARSIPMGSEIDTTQGEISMQTAVGTGGKTQTAKFRDGKFTMQQAAGAKVTDLALTGQNFAKCPPALSKTGPAASSPKRRLWGNGKGRFRTRGRFATATVRGTQWMVMDACKSTTVKVARGVVVVRDLAKRKNVRLKAPKSYTAHAR